MPWTTGPKLELLDEFTGLQALKDEGDTRWRVLDLLDVLKSADFLTGFIDGVTSFLMPIGHALSIRVGSGGLWVRRYPLTSWCPP